MKIEGSPLCGAIRNRFQAFVGEVTKEQQIMLAGLQRDLLDFHQDEKWWARFEDELNKLFVDVVCKFDFATDQLELHVSDTDVWKKIKLDEIQFVDAEFREVDVSKVDVLRHVNKLIKRLYAVRTALEQAIINESKR